MTRSIEEEAATDDVHTQVLWRGARAKALARLGGGAEAVEIAEEAVALSHKSVTDEGTRADALTDLAVTRRFSGLPAAAAAAATEALERYEEKGNIVRVRTTRALLATLRTAMETDQMSSEPQRNRREFS